MANQKITYLEGGFNKTSVNLVYDPVVGTFYVNTTNGTSGSVTVSAPGIVGIFAASTTTADTDGGSMNLYAGTASDGNSGAITIQCGNATDSAGDGWVGGGVNVYGGNLTDTGGGAGNAGEVTLNAGDYSGTGNGFAGAIQIVGGTATTSGSGGNTELIAGDGVAFGGDIRLTAGAASSGTPGNIRDTTSAGYWRQIAGSFATLGDAQSNQYILRTATTTAASTELFLDGTGGTRRMVLSNDSTWRFEIHLVARRTDANNESAAYEIKGCIDNNAATTAFVGTPTVNVTADDSSGVWTVTVAADDTNDALTISVTGEAAKTIRWVAFVRTVEVTG